MTLQNIETLLADKSSNPYRESVPEMETRISFISKHSGTNRKEVKRVMELAHGIYLFDLKKALADETYEEEMYEL